MKIACPNCDTKYALNSDALGTHGRKMKCAKCGHVWTAQPDGAGQELSTTLQNTPDHTQDQVQAAPVEQAEGIPERLGIGLVSQTSGTDSALQQEQSRSDDIDRWEEDLKEERERETKFSKADKTLPFPQQLMARLKKQIEKNKWLHFIISGLQFAVTTGWQNLIQFITWARGLNFANQIALLIALIMPALLVSGLFVGRQFMVRQFPDLASLYALVGSDVNLYGLQFEDVRTVRRPEDGVAVLVVEGNVRNISEKTRDIPRLHFILSGRNREVYAWQDDASLNPLNPGETVRFRSVLASPPDVADELHVRFLSNDPRLNRL